MDIHRPYETLSVHARLVLGDNFFIWLPVYRVDKKVPLSLKEARNAVRIAKDANADQYASAPLQRAQQLLSQADDYYNRKQNDKAIATVAREATQAAEAARVMAIKGAQQARIEQPQREAEQRASKAEADPKHKRSRRKTPNPRRSR